MSAGPSEQWQCYFCAHVYDEALGDPEHGIAPGTAWENVPEDWCCSECGATKADFAKVERG
jgi:rubredoxin